MPLVPFRGKVASRLVALGLGIGASALIGEVAVRALKVAPRNLVVFRENFRLSPNPVLRWEFVPGSPDGKDVISRAGLRDREFEVPKPPGVFRILMIGDSVTSALYVPRQQTIPKLLEDLLRRHAAATGHPTYEVVNLGVTGYNATQVVESLRERGASFEPNLVIYNYVLNDPLPTDVVGEKLDAMANEFERGHTNRLTRLLAHSRLFVFLRTVRTSPPSDALIEWKAPIYEAAVSGTHEAVVRSLHERGSDTWDRVSSALIDLSAWREEHDLPVVVDVLPMAWRPPDDPYALADVHAVVTDEVERLGMVGLDLAPSFAEAQRRYRNVNLFGDLVHPNERGNRLAAMAILRAVCSRELISDGAAVWRHVVSSGGPDAALASTVSVGP
jgi:hypothetical protein